MFADSRSGSISEDYFGWYYRTETQTISWHQSISY